MSKSKGFQARQLENQNSDYGTYTSREEARQNLENHMAEWERNYKPLPEYPSLEWKPLKDEPENKPVANEPKKKKRFGDMVVDNGWI